MEMTKSVAVSDLKAHLSAYLRTVKRGESLMVTERGKPIATLRPSEVADEELASLAAAGLVRLGTGVVPEEFWALPFPEDKESSVRKAVLEERESGW